MRKTLIIVAASVLLIGAGCSRPQSSEQPTPTASATTTRTTREVSMSCTTDMATQFHIHPRLKIFVNGKEREVPAEIGITNGCMHPLHTHDATGELHVESPEARDFTLGDFFAVWGQPFSKDQILDATVDTRHAIHETMNGKPVKDFERTILRDKDEIVIRYE